MEIASIIAELEAQRNRLTNALAALRCRQTKRLTLSGKLDGQRRRMSAATRRKIALGMKKRWAERKKKAA